MTRPNGALSREEPGLMHPQEADATRHRGAGTGYPADRVFGTFRAVLENERVQLDIVG